MTKACTGVFIDSASSDRRTLFSWRSQKKHLEQTVSTCFSRLRSDDIITPSKQTCSLSVMVSAPSRNDDRLLPKYVNNKSVVPPAAKRLRGRGRYIWCCLPECLEIEALTMKAPYKSSYLYPLPFRGVLRNLCSPRYATGGRIAYLRCSCSVVSMVLLRRTIRYDTIRYDSVYLYLADQLQPLAALESRMQKAAILGLGQTGHPERARNYHRRPCILCRWSSCVEQFVVIDAECTFVACI